MKFSSSQQRWLQIAGALGGIQGLAWTILSLICIILRHVEVSSLFPDTLSPNEYPIYSEYLMYMLHFENSRVGQSFREYYGLMSADVFYGFMWIYFFASIAWLISSLLIILRQNHHLIKKYLQGWSALTLGTSVLDFIFVIIVGANYGNCLKIYDEFGSNSISQWECAIGILPVFVTAARGFTLWIINAIFGVVVFKIQRDAS